MRLLSAMACVAALGCTAKIGPFVGEQPTSGDGLPPVAGRGGGVITPEGKTTPPGPGVVLPAALDCQQPHVGAAPLRRLTREQYVRTTRDLLGSMPALGELAADERVGPFNGNVTAPLTDLSAEQYLNAAESLAEAAISNLPKLLGCDAAKQGNDTCAKQFIANFGRRVYRRTLTVAEQDSYFSIYQRHMQGRTFGDGIRVVLTTLLQSPNFLYQVELPPTALPAGQLAPLTGVELAARLSYFMWGTTPDDALLASAEKGELADAAALSAAVERMLQDPRAKDSIGSFHQQWLDVDNVDSISKDPAVYPQFNPDLARAMADEVTAFTDQVLRHGDGRLATLFTSSSSVIDGPLFDLYGVAKPAGFTPGQLVALDPTQRAGLLTSAAFLAQHGHANQSAPVTRGAVVLSRVLCSAPPPPPPDAMVTAPDPAPGLTTRQRFEQHVQNPVCASCHRLMDGIGFGLEAYDGIGRFRSVDGTGSVDVRGELIGTDVDGPFTGSIELGRKLAASKTALQCATLQWFRYAVGRLETPDDACSVQTAYRAFEQADGDIRVLLKTFVTTDAFRMRRGEAL